MEDELELGEGFSGTDEEYELGEESPTQDEGTTSKIDEGESVPDMTDTTDEDGDALDSAFGVGVDPPSGYLSQRFTISVFGSPPHTRSIKLRTSKPGYGRANDPVFATMKSDGTVDVIGTTFLRGRKLDPSKTNTVYVYAQADIPWRPDKYTASVPVELAPTPAVAPKPTPTPATTLPPTAVCSEGTYSADGKMVCRGGSWVAVSSPTTKEYLTPQEADEVIRSGGACYIKSMIPILNMLPGLPYFTGCPILPGFVITTKP